MNDSLQHESAPLLRHNHNTPAAESAAVTRRSFLRGAGALVIGGTVLTACSSASSAAADPTATLVPSMAVSTKAPPTAIPTPTPAAVAAPAATPTPQPARPVTADRVAADPTNIPGPVDWKEPKRHKIELETVEVIAEIEPGVTFSYMTFGGQVPGPMIRVRQGDTVEFTLISRESDIMPHNIDFHSVYGPGGGAEATDVSPGQSNGMIFQARYPGAFLYHCAVPILDYHISSGMYGMIVVEPPDGLTPVDHEFYVGQNEVYTDLPVGTKGHHNFGFAAMRQENATYVLLNGEKYALTPDRRGAMKVKVGETARIFFVCGGPNLACNFHPIGNVWSKAWREGALMSAPELFVQTMSVPPGSCGVFEMEFPVPGQVKLVDHAITRVVSKGMLGIIEVEGPEQPDIFNPTLPGEPT
ncbi:MAG: copper-containing nitrite reductase [Caldilineaceae bacterium]